MMAERKRWENEGEKEKPAVCKCTQRVGPGAATFGVPVSHSSSARTHTLSDDPDRGTRTRENSLGLFSQVSTHVATPIRSTVTSHPRENSVYIRRRNLRLYAIRAF